MSANTGGRGSASSTLDCRFLQIWLTNVPDHSNHPGSCYLCHTCPGIPLGPKCNNNTFFCSARAIIFCELYRGKQAAVSIMRRVCCISPKAGASFMMSSEDVISKLRKKKNSRGIINPSSMRTGRKCQSYYQLRRKRTFLNCSVIRGSSKKRPFFFVEALRLSIHRTSLITLVAWKTSTVCFSRYQQSLFSRWLACSLKWQITVGRSASTGWSSSEHKQPWNFSSWITLKNTGF